MSTKTEVENLKTSGAEKVLAVVLAAFILIGAFWAYEKIGELGDGSGGSFSDEYSYSSESGYGARSEALNDLEPEDRQALEAKSQARNELFKAQRDVRTANRQAVLARENWRAELDAGLQAPEQEAAYREAQRDLEAAREQLSLARFELAETRPAAEAADRNLREAIDDAKDRDNRDQAIVFFLRLLLVAGMLAGGYVAMARIRRRRSRLLPLALAVVVAGAVLGLYMAADYGASWGLFDDVGPLIISIVGIALTVLAFVLLQRYLAKQIPLRRVRKHECPFCGYPARENRNCEGCGRRLLGECSSCHQSRRVGAPHCGSCGKA
jgi:hypothetical protein